MLPRTDLAMEAKELFERSAGEQTRLSGVLARETDRRGVRMTLVRILDAEGEQALGTPRGPAITAERAAHRRGGCPGPYPRPTPASCRAPASATAGRNFPGARSACRSWRWACRR